MTKEQWKLEWRRARVWSRISVLAGWKSMGIADDMVVNRNYIEGMPMGTIMDFGTKAFRATGRKWKCTISWKPAA